MDFNCGVTPTVPNDGGPIGASGRQACAADDTWSGKFSVGAHTVTVWPSGGGSGDHTFTVTATNARPEVDSTALVRVSETGITTEQVYEFFLFAESSVSVRLTGLSRDFDCSVDGDTHSCTDNVGTLDDKWTGTLSAGAHTVKITPVVASDSDDDETSPEPGDYTLTVTAEPPSMDSDDEDDDEEEPEPEPEPEPDPPGAPTLAGSVNVKTHVLTWTAPTSSTAISGYRLESRSSATTDWATPRGGSTPASSLSATTLTWNIVTPPSTTSTYRVLASNEDGEGPWSNEITLTSVDVPEQVSITGSVVRQTQTVSWSAPQSDSPITQFQLQTRNSSTSAWRWPGSGTPTASNMPATTKSWSVTTPSGLHRHYRVRVVSLAGEGSWSSHVELTSYSPPPLELPSIPNFSDRPSGGSVTTTFPAATGGTPPYEYSVTGLPPGTPSPSSQFGATVRSWQVTTPPGLHRQYRVRARNATGAGEWSNIVSLTSQGGGGASGAGGDDDSTDDDGDGDDDGYECADDDEGC